MRNLFVNLANPLFLFSEPISPTKTVYKECDEFLGVPVKALPSGM